MVGEGGECGVTEDLTPLNQSVFSALSGLGISHIKVTIRLINEWDELAGDPWAGQTRPLGIRDGELIIETATAALVSMFRYATGSLHQRLEDSIGEGVISSITVQSPPRFGS
jgi:hypothetical protein